MPEDKQTLMVLRGDFVDIMCQVDPDNKRYRLRALYGCIESALLWYNLYVKDMGFVINSYDRCVAKKTSTESIVQYAGMLTMTKFHTKMKRSSQAL